MILHSRVVEQPVDVTDRGVFVKELVLARGAAPIALVRKRAAHGVPGRLGADVVPESLALPTRAPVLLIHGYGQNRYAFHLPSRSFVNHLARAGFDVFNVDLRGRGRSAHLGARRPAAVEDFIREDVPAALDVIESLSGRRPVFLIGHSLGGIVSYCVSVEEPARVAGVVTLGSPYHFTRGSPWLTVLGAAFRTLDARVSLPNLPVPTRAYGRFVRTAQRLVESRLYPVPLRGFRPGSVETEVLREHMAMAMDTGSISTMRGMFDWARQARQDQDDQPGMFGYGRRFEARDLPLLVIAGRYDDLAPPDSVKPAYDRSRSTDRTYRELPFGHVDLLIGREAPQLTWPIVEQWLKQRSA
ncbi:MAG: alpha/beta fold hydrolase [Polyangiaceae bacterium]|nr:alpha/beta fold hydrolase [Polyangiaceae bacterium]